MEYNDIQRDKIKIIMKEYNSLWGEINLFTIAMTRDLQICLGFIVGILAIANRGENNGIINLHIILTIMPHVIFAFSLFFVNKLSDIVVAGAYIEIIENKINSIFKTNLLNWQSLITKNYLFNIRSGSPFMISSILLGILIFVGYTIISYKSLSYISGEKLKVFISFIYVIYPIWIGALLLRIFYDNKQIPDKINNLLT